MSNRMAVRHYLIQDAGLPVIEIDADADVIWQCRRPSLPWILIG